MISSTGWRVAVLGCGLMSGSAALALRDSGRAGHISGYSPSASSRNKALAVGAIQSAHVTPQEAMEGADVVLLGMPVGALPDVLRDIRGCITPHMLLTDVGSTKRDVSQAALDVLGDLAACMVPAHPVAGKEVSGVEHAEATLLLNKRVILTPLACNSSATIERAQQVWSATGAVVSTLDAATHDRLFAHISHLPHLLAFAYLNALADLPECEQALAYAGPGFRDFSRIGASEPQVWRDILMANRDEVLLGLDAVRQTLNAWESALRSGNAMAMQEAIDAARQLRAPWALQVDQSSVFDDQ